MSPAMVVPRVPPPPGGDGSGLGTHLSEPVGAMAASSFDAAMQKVWDAGALLLRGAFTLADEVARFDPAAITGGEDGGIGSLWPSMTWLAAMIALGLFFAQLVTVALRGGRGMFRAFSGPAQFGIAIALTGGAIATLLTAADGLTALFLGRLAEDGTFVAVLDAPATAGRFGPDPDLGAIEEGTGPMVLGLAAFFGTIPAGVGLALLMVFRQAAVLVLVATIPITAAALVADTTASIFWRSARWILAAVLVEPVLALVLLAGVTVTAGTEGVAGLLAAVTVLLVALISPVVVFRLLAVVDPATGAGLAARSRGRSAGQVEPVGDGGATESIHVARFTASGPAPAVRVEGSPSTTGELGGTTAHLADGPPAGRSPGSRPPAGTGAPTTAHTGPVAGTRTDPDPGTTPASGPAEPVLSGGGTDDRGRRRER
jgi:hypothetical protein